MHGKHAHYGNSSTLSRSSWLADPGVASVRTPDRAAPAALAAAGAATAFVPGAARRVAVAVASQADPKVSSSSAGDT